MRRIILTVLGFLALALGGIGMLLPVMPTTPFVLCAAGCFGASNPKLYKRLAHTRYFGEYIQNYQNKCGISTKARVTGLLFLWPILLLSIFFSQNTSIRILLLIIGVAVSIHILTIRKCKTNNKPPI